MPGCSYKIAVMVCSVMFGCMQSFPDIAFAVHKF